MHAALIVLSTVIVERAVLIQKVVSGVVKHQIRATERLDLIIATITAILNKVAKAACANAITGGLEINVKQEHHTEECVRPKNVLGNNAHRELTYAQAA